MKHVGVVPVLIVLILPAMLPAQTDLIPNADFEDWTSFGPTHYGAFQPPNLLFRTVFPSTDAQSGSMSVLLRNISFFGQRLNAGIFTCDGDCRNGPGEGDAGLKRLSFPVTQRYNAICGYYKGTLLGGDKLWISLALQSGQTVVAGTDSGSSQAAFIITDANDWTLFSIPITDVPGKEEVTPNGATLEIGIFGAGFPSNSIDFGTVGSTIYVDNLFFCNPVDLDIHRPTILGGELIPERVESLLGSQTFVNLDNDDQDELFDWDPETKKHDMEVKEEDELVRIVLRLQPETLDKGKAYLKAIQGEKYITVWKSATKGELFDLKTELQVPDDFEIKDDSLVKELWVEGIEPHTVQQGTRLEFTYSEKPDEKDEVSLTIVGIDRIDWKGQNNSRYDDEYLDLDGNHKNADGSALKPEAVRVFPGSRMDAADAVESVPRNMVTVDVTLSVPPVEPLKIYFDSFDVDDPTASRSNSPLDNESRNEDNRGVSPAKSGKFPGESEGILEVEFMDNQTSFDFEVTLQPGDNFRIVGNGDKDYLKDLHNNDVELNKPTGGANTNKQRIVNRFILTKHDENPQLAEIRLPDNYASDVLTVWRFLYVEVDHMDVVKGNTVSATVHDIWLDDPIPGWTTLGLGVNLGSVSPHGTWGLLNRFEDGTLSMGGVGNFSIDSSTANWWLKDTAVVYGLDPGFDIVGFSYEMVDDDVDHGFEDGAWIPYADTGGLANHFSPAYILPDISTLPNAKATTPFVLNTESDLGSYLQTNYRFDNMATEASEYFWTVYVLSAFQGTPPEDGDPDDGTEAAIAGIVDGLNGIGAHIFIEGLNELVGGSRLPTTTLGRGEQDAVAHELGHLFGAEHGDDLLMDQVGNMFSDKSLAKIRSARHP